MSEVEKATFARVQAAARELATAIEEARSCGLRVDLRVHEEDRFGPLDDMRLTIIEARTYKRVRS